MARRLFFACRFPREWGAHLAKRVDVFVDLYRRVHSIDREVVDAYDDSVTMK